MLMTGCFAAIPNSHQISRPGCKVCLVCFEKGIDEVMTVAWERNKTLFMAYDKCIFTVVTAGGNGV